MNYILIRKKESPPLSKTSLSNHQIDALPALHHLDPLSVLQPLCPQLTPHQLHQPHPHPRAFAPAVPVINRAHCTLLSAFAQLSSFPGLTVPTTPHPTPIYLSLQPPSLSNILCILPVLCHLPPSERKPLQGRVLSASHSPLHSQGLEQHLTPSWGSGFRRCPSDSLPSVYLCAS